MQRHSDAEIVAKALELITLRIAQEPNGNSMMFPWRVLRSGIEEILSTARARAPDVVLDIRGVFEYLNMIQTLATDVRALMSGMRMSEDAAEIKRLSESLRAEKSLFERKLNAPLREE